MMNRINPIKYNPLFSFIRYLQLKVHRRIQYPDHNIGESVTLSDSGEYSVFLEMDILDEKNKPKQGDAVFRIIFHSPDIPVETIMKRTKYTIPFFSGLPGFCTKQFMINRKDSKFSGRYEWESVDMAKNYARSFAVMFMKKRSKPLPVSYEIFDKKTKSIVESRVLETGKREVI